MSDEQFVLDRVDNPHPKMLAGALAARAAARRTNGWPSVGSSFIRGEWEGYLMAMCDATGETPEAIEAWMDRMETQDG